jgi:Luciferase
MENIVAQIRSEVASWDGVSVHPHRFGGTEFRLGGRELGHLHGERWVDLPFPRRIRDMLVETGRASPHHVLPHTGWVSRQISSGEDVGDVIELFRLAYERARVAQVVRESRQQGAKPLGDPRRCGEAGPLPQEPVDGDA